jgi:hypothetical protein
LQSVSEHATALWKFMETEVNNHDFDVQRKEAVSNVGRQSKQVVPHVFMVNNDRC